MIVIVDYGLGNVRSIHAKIDQMGETATISHEKSEIEDADILILPGVGAFDTGMHNLKTLDLIDTLHRKIVREKIPTLGICLGMQLFTKKSEEGLEKGLSYIDANTIRFQFPEGGALPVPHMGWNTINKKREVPILSGIMDNSRFYFVHSYHISCNNPQDIVAITSYGEKYPSIIHKDNIVGVQFHPEKSHKQGIILLKNFVKGAH
jgi:glutamine amidotransferase